MKKVQLTTAVLMASIAPATVSAQVLDEVMVTAQKRSESLQDVPIAVTAFTEEAMRDFGIENTQQLQATTPGLVFNTTGISAQPYIRGVGTRLALNGLEPSVATYLDDRYISRATASTLEFADIQRIEVLKGPQGTLYGRNATGGAIRVITKDVSDELEGSVRAIAGNYDYVNLSGTVSVPVTDEFGFRITGLYKERDGFADNLSPVGPSTLDDIDYQALRTKFRWHMNDSVTARLSLNYWQRDDNQANDIVDLSPPGLNRGSAAGGISGTKVDEVATTVVGTTDGEEFSGQLRFDVALDKADLVSITTFTDLEQNFITDGDGTSAVAADLIGGPDTLTNYSQEFQLISNASTGPRWIVGAYFFSEEADLDLIADLSGFFPGFTFSQGLQTVETTASAVFGQLTWDLNDSWALTLGGRFNYEEKDVLLEGSKEIGFTYAPGVALPYSDSDSWTEFTPKATLEYTFDEGMLYLTYARGFKSGGFNYPAAPGEPLDSEILDMVELGMKGNFADNRVRVNLAAYYYDYSGLQVTRASGGLNASATTENAAEAEIYGFDADITWLASQSLSITAGLNLLDTEYTDYEAAAKSFNGTPGTVNFGFDASGESLLRAPDLSYFVSLTKDFSVGDARVPLIVTYSYTDSYLFDFIVEPETAALKQDSYGLLTARLSYVSPDETWQVALFGNNLTDEEYFDDVVASGPGVRGSWGAPRTYGVEVNFSF